MTTALQAGDTITVTFPVTGTVAVAASAFYFTGIKLNPLDRNNGNTGSLSDPTVSTSAATQQATEVTVAAFFEGGTTNFTSPSCQTTGTSQIDTPSTAPAARLRPYWNNPTATGVQTCSATLSGGTSPPWAGAITTYYFDAEEATNSTLTPTSSSITANGTAAQTLTVQAKDQNI